MTWSNKDERRYAEIQKESAQMEKARVVAWNRVHEALMRAWDKVEGEITADLAIRHADEIRDALAPFDSGVRCEPERA